MQIGETWSNWSGGVTCQPLIMAAPTSEAAVVDLVRRAREGGLVVRVAGTGHSFVPLCATDGVLISLDGLQGIVAADRGGLAATVWAGTKLHQLGEPLVGHGLAMENLGDIDRQSVAGAISTGTHGTGPGLGNISTQVARLRLILASGEIVECSPELEPELFSAARVSLGVLGILSQVTLRALPAYYLHERTWIAPFEACMDDLDNLIGRTRHFEFFWSPQEDACAMKALHPADPEQSAAPVPMPEAEGRLVRYVKPERIDWSYRILPSERNLKFNEMEFAVPAEHGPACMREIRGLMLDRHPDVIWPVEYRTLRADDIPLSPACGRATVTISIHQDAALPYRAFFADAEAIFRHYRGRPHWGKVHWHTARDLRGLYPLWDEFQAVRERVDPVGRFLNPYLRNLLIE